MNLLRESVCAHRSAIPLLLFVAEWLSDQPEYLGDVVAAYRDAALFSAPGGGDEKQAVVRLIQCIETIPEASSRALRCSLVAARVIPQSLLDRELTACFVRTVDSIKRALWQRVEAYYRGFHSAVPGSVFEQESVTAYIKTIRSVRNPAAQARLYGMHLDTMDLEISAALKQKILDAYFACAKKITDARDRAGALYDVCRHAIPESNFERKVLQAFVACVETDLDLPQKVEIYRDAAQSERSSRALAQQAVVGILKHAEFIEDDKERACAYLDAALGAVPFSAEEKTALAGFVSAVEKRKDLDDRLSLYRTAISKARQDSLLAQTAIVHFAQNADAIYDASSYVNTYRSAARDVCANHQFRSLALWRVLQRAKDVPSVAERTEARFDVAYCAEENSVQRQQAVTDILHDAESANPLDRPLIYCRALLYIAPGTADEIRAVAGFAQSAESKPFLDISISDRMRVYHDAISVASSSSSDLLKEHVAAVAIKKIEELPSDLDRVELARDLLALESPSSGCAAQLLIKYARHVEKHADATEKARLEDILHGLALFHAKNTPIQRWASIYFQKMRSPKGQDTLTRENTRHFIRKMTRDKASLQ